MANLSDKFSTYGLSLATAQVEFLLNTNSSTSETSGANTTGTYAYGSVGQAILAYSNAGNWVTKRVSALVALSAQDRITLELSEDGNEWTDASNRLPAMEAGSAKYGARVIQVSGSSSTLDVQFGGNGATGTEAWSAYTTWFWRVRVTRANLSAGFSEVSQSAAGLVQRAGQLIGTNTNDSAAAGYVGQYVESLLTGAGATPTDLQHYDIVASPITLTAGDWDISGSVQYDSNGGTWAQVRLGIGTSAGNSSAGMVPGQNQVDFTGPSTVTAVGLVIPPYRVSISSTTSYYLKGLIDITGGSPRASGARISARRVR